VAQEYVKGLLSGGEVVLVDTRQHWMAAIRYALKPILLVGAVALVGLLNSWLSDWLGDRLTIITDIVQWILVLMIIVAVIWLPINLVQWYSRKYVLTNRRAMRMSGVVRKTSFDSSLEQINDISLEQTFIGRTLGYANLTLFTASDTANEQYEQLMDGLQFKKAVLDAKEGIRLSAPLMELPVGFIVKGGTNEASMRADGKIEEAAKQSGPPASDAAVGDDADAVQAPAPAAVEPAVAPEPEPVAAAEPEAAAAPEPEAAATDASPTWPATDPASPGTADADETTDSKDSGSA
jgi:hypothetical protein